MLKRHFALSTALYVALFALTILPNGLSATTVRQLEFDALVANAALIFTGEVIDRQAVWNQQKTHIDSLITFRVQQVIKGEYNDARIVLRFAGGEIGAVREYVEGMVYPEIGERGLYFVETLERTQVNPLLGWQQGHFIRVEIDGVERVFSADGRPLERVYDPADTSTTSVLKSSTKEHAAGFAKGLIPAAQKMSAMPIEDFLEAIEARLSAPTR